MLVKSGEILPNHPCCVVVASDDYLGRHPDETVKLLEIHANATKFINDKIADDDTDDVVGLLPADIISNKDIEEDSLESFPFISGLNESFKKDVKDFMNLEVELGILKKPISDDKLYWEGSK